MRRKAFHLVGLVYPVCYAWLGRDVFVVCAAALLVLTGAVETARLRSPAVRRWMEARWGRLLRPSEARRFTGAFWMVSGALAAGLLAPSTETFAAAFAYLIFGDAAASLVGRRFGGPRWFGSQKRVSGSAACFLVCVAAGWLILGADVTWPIILVGAGVVTVTEAVSGPVDDNLTVPVVAALFFRLAG